MYHVAVTLDGFIARPDGGVEGFVEQGDHVADYLQHLQRYDTVIMGRSTYEFGYRYGLQPGQRAYPHMRHYVFSRTLEMDSTEHVEVVRDAALERVRALKAEDGSDIYLCGGGRFAGFLLEHGLIDRLLLKVNPVVFGDGVRLFQGNPLTQHFRTTEVKRYDSGVLLSSYTAENEPAEHA